MAFFTAGNLITLAIVALLLVLFRQLDKGKRPLDMLRKYSEKLKEELARYAAEKEEAVKNYGVSLDVEQQAARELMKKLQLSSQELAGKASAIAKIDERISGYDASLEELVGMTVRVEENLERLRDESAFVEDTFSQVKGLREKLGGLEKDLGTLGQRFRRENGEALEKTREAVLSSVESAIGDLEERAETVGARVEDHRQAVDKIEAERAEKLEWEEEQIRSLLTRSLEEAGRRADKLEDAALAKLRDQAQDRVEKLKTALEEKIRAYQENAKARAGEIQELLRQQRGEAKTIAVELAQAVKEQQQERQIGEAAFAVQNEQINAALSLQEQKWLEVSVDMDAATVRQEEKWRETQAAMEKALALQEQKWRESCADIDAAVASQEEHLKSLAAALEDTQETQRKEWRSAGEEFKNLLISHNSEVEDSLAAQKKRVESLLADQEEDLESSLIARKQQMESEIAALKDRTEGGLRSHISQMEAGFAAHKKEVESELVLHRERTESALGALKDQTGAELAAIADRMEKDLAVHGDRVEADLAVLKDQAAADFAAFEAQRASDFAALKGRTENELAVYTGQIESTLAAQRQEWTNLAAAGHDSLKVQYEQWRSAMDEALRRALEESEGQLGSYQAAQAEEFRRLALIADDASRLETELRRIMEEAESQVRSNFARFEEEASGLRQSAAAAFDTQVRTFKASLEELRGELAELTETAHGALSEKLNAFEEEFFADLSQRKADIERRFAGWQETVDQRLAALGEEALTGRREMEAALAEESRRNLAAQGEKLAAGLERLRQESAALESGIRQEMLAADEARDSFRARLSQDLEELRLSAESSIKVEIGRYTLSVQENLKQNQREMEGRLKEITDTLEARNSELRASQERVRELAEENDSRLVQFRANLDRAREDAVSQRQEILERTQEEARGISAAVEEAERRIRDFSAQTRLFERTDELKTELERRIEDLRGDIDRLDQRKSEVAQMEGEFVRIRRLGDEVGAKMNRFLLEQRRIEVMEGDFNRIIQTSQAVEEKLAQIQDTDDTLEALQVQLRRMEDAVREAEEKYQRVERKSETLEETNNGIARNFKALQDTEAFLARLKTDQEALASRLAKQEGDLASLAAESGKAQITAEKLGLLDESLAAIEQRIRDMQKAREWLAGLETRMNELYRQAQDHVKLAGTIIKNDQGPPRDSSITPALRENVLRLARQHWTKEAISNALKISQGEVELILEFGGRDTD
jgi:DNA repair exonuclease SbcCD ATPase subunit